MIGVLGLGLDLPYVKEFVASIVGVSGFAYGWYKYGRRVGSIGDRAVIDAQKDRIFDLNHGSVNPNNASQNWKKLSKTLKISG